MNSYTTFSIHFWINASRCKNGLASIYARISVDRVRVNFSVKRKINPRYWDTAKNRAISNHSKFQDLNLYLDQVQSKIFHCYQELLYNDEIISAQKIKTKYLGLNKNKYTVNDIIEYHNEKMAHKLHKDTLRHYKTSQNYLKKYLQKRFKSQHYYLKDLNYEFIVGFESFLREYQPKDHQKKMSNNTAMKHLQRLRKMVTLAYKIEWIDKDPFRRFQTRTEKRSRSFLSQTELRNIEDYSPSLERLKIVKDIFVFSCYTGLSFGDLLALQRENLIIGDDGNFWIKTLRQKTSEPIKIPLLPKALNLIQEYNLHPRTIESGRLFPNISNQKTNSYLKELADFCGISKNLTFHVARHTFATTVTLSNGVPIETVSKLLGHSKLATTQIYARVLEKKISKDMEALKNKLTGNTIKN